MKDIFQACYVNKLLNFFLSTKICLKMFFVFDLLNLFEKWSLLTTV